MNKFTTFLLLLLSLNCFAKYNIDISTLNTNDGALSDEILSTFQDKEGFLWFFTKNGINLYDGYQISNFNISDLNIELHTTFFTKAIDDGQGNIWIANSKDGVLVFNKNNNEYTLINLSTIASNNVLDLAKGKNGEMWIATSNGLVKYFLHNKKYIAYQSNDDENSIPDNYIESLAVDDKGNLWIGTWGQGLSYLDTNKETFTSFKYFFCKNDKYESNQVNKLFFDSKGYLWVNAWQAGVFICDVSNPEELTVLHRFNEMLPNKGSIVHQVVEYDDTYIFATPNGIYSVREPLKQESRVVKYKTPESNSLSSTEIVNIFKDKSGIFWISTIGSGIIKVNLEQHQFQPHTIAYGSDLASSQTITCFHKNAQDELLIGVQSSGFGNYNAKSQKFTSYKTFDEFYLSSGFFTMNTVTCFMENDEDMWYGTRYAGLIRHNKKTNKFTKYDSYTTLFFNAKRINQLLTDKQNRIWVASEDGLFLFTKNGNEYSLENIVDRTETILRANSVITTMLLEDNGKLWIGTTLGELILVDNIYSQKKEYNIKYIPTKKDKSLSSIQCIIRDNKNNLWFGTKADGLYKYNRKRIQRESHKLGLSVNTINSIIEDDNGNLWLATNKGLYNLSFSDSNEYTVSKYTVDDGLQGNFFIKGASLKDNNGYIYIGGHYGFNIFHPDSITRDTYVAPTKITKITVDGSTIKPTNSLELSHDNSNFAFEFATLSFSKNHKNRYAYQLENYNDSWVYTEASNRKAQFSNIPPGEYIFKVKGSNNNGVWNDTKTQIKIKIKPSPFKTGVAYIIYLLLGTSIIIIIFKIYSDRLKMSQNIELERVKRQKEESVNTFKLRFFTNISHELLTPLSVISCVSEENPQKGIGTEGTKIINNNVHKLKHLIRQLLEFRKIETGNINLQVRKGNPAILLLNLYEDFNILAKKKNITLNINIPDDLSMWFDKDSLDKIMHNLLSNAIKYTPEKGEVNIEASQDNKQLKVSVSDTGKGIPQSNTDSIFNRFYRFDGNSGGEFGMGIGLALTKNIIMQNNGTIEVTSEVGKGSKFTINIPAQKESYDEKDVIDEHIVNYDTHQKSALKEDINYISVDHRVGLSEQKDVKVLIVEDNVDLLNLLSARFGDGYQTIKAKNGIEALKQIESHNIDIVISDVMMPEMNGYQLCNKLKENIETSHIPIILLTAKISDESTIAGYNSGADSYLTKPVNMDILQARIESILKNREHWQNKFKGSLILPEEASQKLPLEEEFISKVKQTVLDNLDNEKFSVKNLYSTMGASNSTLNRKLSSITGLKPNEFIRHIRLHTAAQYLKNGTHNISEAAISTGYSDVSYFGACFKKEFGIPPSSYIKKHINSSN